MTLTILMKEELCTDLNANTLAGQICNCSKPWLTISVLIAFPSFICSSKTWFFEREHQNCVHSCTETLLRLHSALDKLLKMSYEYLINRVNNSLQYLSCNSSTVRLVLQQCKGFEGGNARTTKSE